MDCGKKLSAVRRQDLRCRRQRSVQSLSNRSRALDFRNNTIPARNKDKGTENSKLQKTNPVIRNPSPGAVSTIFHEARIRRQCDGRENESDQDAEQRASSDRRRGKPRLYGWYG